MILVSASVVQSQEPPISRIYSFLIPITLNSAVCSALACQPVIYQCRQAFLSLQGALTYFLQVNKSFKVFGGHKKVRLAVYSGV